MAMAGILMLGGFTLAYHADRPVVIVPDDPTYPAPLTAEQQRYAAFFAKHGSPAPEDMAVAVTQAKPKNRPVLAAVAVQESNGTPWAVGDNGESHGSMQVQPKHWGKVPADPVGQILQAERILDELVASAPRRSLRCGLARYNGGTTPGQRAYRYASRVLKLAQTIHKGDNT